MAKKNGGEEFNKRLSEAMQSMEQQCLEADGRKRDVDQVDIDLSNKASQDMPSVFEDPGEGMISPRCTGRLSTRDTSRASYGRQGSTRSARNTGRVSVRNTRNTGRVSMPVSGRASGLASGSDCRDSSGQRCNSSERPAEASSGLSAAPDGFFDAEWAPTKVRNRAGRFRSNASNPDDGGSTPRLGKAVCKITRKEPARWDTSETLDSYELDSSWTIDTQTAESLESIPDTIEITNAIASTGETLPTTCPSEDLPLPRASFTKVYFKVPEEACPGEDHPPSSAAEAASDPKCVAAKAASALEKVVSTRISPDDSCPRGDHSQDSTREQTITAVEEETRTNSQDSLPSPPSEGSPKRPGRPPMSHRTVRLV